MAVWEVTEQEVRGSRRENQEENAAGQTQRGVGKRISCFLGGALEDNARPLSSRYNRRSQEGSIDIAGAGEALAAPRPSDGEPA